MKIELSPEDMKELAKIVSEDISKKFVRSELLDASIVAVQDKAKQVADAWVNQASFEYEVQAALQAVVESKYKELLINTMRTIVKEEMAKIDTTPARLTRSLVGEELRRIAATYEEEIDAFGL